jgi:hypothetical protein
MGETKRLDLRLQVGPGAPAQARHEVGALAAHLPQELRENLQLLVSELVANSLRHAELADGDSIGLQASLEPDAVRVEVSDPGRSFNPSHGGDLGTTTRSGLWIVDQLASRWGLDRDGQTRVWFEADLPASEAARWLEAIGAWPDKSKEQALDLARRFGPPGEWEAGRLTWRPTEGLALTLEPAEPRP